MSDPYAPAKETFGSNDAVKSALQGYGDFAKTGGYSTGDISNLRERSISPIRSIYANAQNNLRRQKVLSGGYSPNYGAASAKMARDSAGVIGDQSTNVEAKLAEMVNEGKKFGISGQAGLGEQEAEAERGVGARNAASTNTAEQFNREFGSNILDKLKGLDSSDLENKLKILSGMISMYGTNPALANTFGNQAMSAASMGNNNLSNLISMGTNFFGRR